MKQRLPAAVALTAALLLAAGSAAAQTPTGPGGMRGASEPMTNKAAQPPGATASAPADKKPAKAGAQSGPTPSSPSK